MADVFENYFRLADTNHDGRISGQEAVSFFQRANLPQKTLAKIWQCVDQGQTGSLSRPEFYNALRLVTVAQSGRELTPEIVRTVLVGSLNVQIPPPQINLVGAGAGAGPTYRPPQALSTAGAGMGGVGPTYRPPVAPTVGAGGVGSAAAYRPPSDPTMGAGMGMAPPAYRPQMQVGGGGPMPSSLPPRPSPNNGSGMMTTITPTLTQAPAPLPSSKPPPAQSNAFSGFGQLDAFTSNKDVPAKVVAAGPTPTPTPSPPPPSAVSTADLFGGDTFQANPGKLPLPPAGPAPAPAPAPTPVNARNPQQGFTGPAPGAWPKLVQRDLQRYSDIFTKVDSDRDGKISGNQARELFLSWQLPRDALKRIWDLSDQDHDSMLSFREFCIAVYLMERFREGRTLPPMINPALVFDESAISALQITEAQAAVAQRSAGMNASGWQQNPGLLQNVRGQVMGTVPAQPVLPPNTMSPTPPQQTAPAPDAPPKSKAPALESNLVCQLPADDQLTLKSKHGEAEEAEKKVQELEKDIKDAKEKMDFYRTKLQEIILFKTRCDNQLAEISMRVSGDKLEVETLAKRYNEKFKQAGDTNSRLVSDEATFRDLQERKLELYNVIIRIEQGGDDNTQLQSRVDAVQSDLAELRKALNEKCKRIGLKTRPSSVLELPYGWQRGIQEKAVEWDENWNAFEEEGFVVVEDLLDEAMVAKQALASNAATGLDENDFMDDEFDLSSMDSPRKSKVDESGARSPKADSEDGSSVHSGAISPSRDSSVSSPRHDKTSWDSKENHNHDAAGPLSSSLEGDLFSDSSPWEPDFLSKKEDGNSEMTMSWGSNTTATTTKASFDGSPKPTKVNPSSSSFFGFDDSFSMLPAGGHDHDEQDFRSLGLGTIRTKEKPSTVFDNSVPSTPLFPASGGLFNDGANSSRDLFARFDSFSSVQDVGGPPKFPSESLARFDSFRPPSDTSQPGGFLSFDDFETPKHIRGDNGDHFADTGAFGAQRQTSKQSNDIWSAFG